MLLAEQGQNFGDKREIIENQVSESLTVIFTCTPV